MSGIILTLFDQDFAPRQDEDKNKSLGTAGESPAKKNKRSKPAPSAAPDLLSQVPEAPASPPIFDATNSDPVDDANTALITAIDELETATETEILEIPRAESGEEEKPELKSTEVDEARSEVLFSETEHPVVSAETELETETITLSLIEEPELTAQHFDELVVNNKSEVSPESEKAPGTPKPQKATKKKEPKEVISPDVPDNWEPGKQYFSIGEVAEMFKVNTSHIRFWTNEFRIKVRTTRKGDRLYTAAQIKELKAIHHLVKERGFTLSGAKAKLKDQKGRDVHAVDLKDSLTSLRNKLSAIKNHLG